MQKYIDKGSELQIRSAVALDHLKNYIYVEADKEAHVREVLSCEMSVHKEHRSLWIKLYVIFLKYFAYVFRLAKVYAVYWAKK